MGGHNITTIQAKTTMERQEKSQERPQRPASTELMVISTAAHKDTSVYLGAMRIHATKEDGPVNFEILKHIAPGSNGSTVQWDVEVKGLASGDPRKEIVAETVRRHCASHGEKAGGKLDVLYIDETMIRRVMRYPAWITLAGKNYELDVVKTSNGKTSFEFDIITECDDAFREILIRTAEWYAQRNPVGNVPENQEQR